MTKKRISIRLDDETLSLIDRMRTSGTTRTDIVVECLLDLRRKLFFDRVEEDEVKQLIGQQRKATRADHCIQLRLDDYLLEYFKLNCYNLTSCVKTAVRDYYNQKRNR